MAESERIRADEDEEVYDPSDKFGTPEDAPMPREMRSRFGWQDHEQIVLYDDDGNRISEAEWRKKLDAKKKKLKAKNP